MTDAHLDEKEACLKRRLAEMGSVLVAFSGGVDSTLLLAVAREVLGDRAQAVIGTSPVYARREIREAVALAERLGAPYTVLDLATMDLDSFRDNPEDRCYSCKRVLIRECWRVARERGIAHVLEGANRDDMGDYRPGRRAVAEGGAASPLLECGLTKSDIRELSRRRGLPTWDKPSMACLASRFPYGTPITEEALRRIEACEEALFAEGFRQVRVRHHGTVARIEVAPEEIPHFLDPVLRARVDGAIRAQGFAYAALDLSGYRTGSMNEVLGRGDGRDEN